MAHQDHNIKCNFRIPAKLHRDFFLKAARVGTPSEVLRELMRAFVEGRVTVAPLSVAPTRKE